MDKERVRDPLHYAVILRLQRYLSLGVQCACAQRVTHRYRLDHQSSVCYDDYRIQGPTNWSIYTFNSNSTPTAFTTNMINRLSFRALELSWLISYCGRATGWPTSIRGKMLLTLYRVTRASQWLIGPPV